VAVILEKNKRYSSFFAAKRKGASRMKKIYKTAYILIWMLLFSLLASGCGAAGTEAQAAQDNGQESKEPEEQADQGESGAGESQGMIVRIYHGDDRTESICVNTARTEKVTPEILLLNLASYKMLPDTAAVERFEQEETEEGKVLRLDLSEEFRDFLAKAEEDEKDTIMGSLVNTFLDAYEGESICITVQGKPLDSYGGNLGYYPYQEASYTVETAEINEDSVHILYPQLKGLSNMGLQDYWNEVIREQAEELAKDVQAGGGDWEGTYTVKTMDNELFSVLLEGGGYQEGAAHPVRLQYTYNIDLTTGENVRLAHWVDVEKTAENLMAGTGFTVEGELDGEFQERMEILYVSTEQLAAALRGFDFSTGREIPAGFSYQENGKTHLCMEVPHALGDYVDITLE